MKNKRFAALATAAAIMLGVCGCAGNTTSSTVGGSTDVSSAEENTSKELEELTVVLDWYPNGSHVFLYDAIEEGYYEEEGLKIKVEFPSNTNDAISMTSAGKADIGFYYMHDVIQANANQDIPVV